MKFDTETQSLSLISIGKRAKRTGPDDQRAIAVPVLAQHQLAIQFQSLHHAANH